MTIEDIIETLEKTDMPDGRIDAFITCAFLLKQLRPADPSDFDGPHDYMPSSIKSQHGFLMARPFTHDVNHAIDLCREIRPDAVWHLARGQASDDCLYGAQLREIEEGENVLGEAESNHAALALTLAALRAHVRQQDGWKAGGL
ncbi:hypothetical protein [Rhizobium leguminosarum]|uniref:Uncharacterized protein n=1 Tax=Rhizobium leguminosarum TaxID=384 RepID=A0A7W9ZNL1_RHILE|nr:hypothetical protein [Rhizobium leguminosarum]MBB5666691.1 hypothetical protein [Rhizobium leguminosarum]MBB6219976.1 hypothetical protein [Rhizobium leguminosarum]